MKKKINYLLIVIFVVTTANAQGNLKQTFNGLENKWMNSWKNKDEKIANEILSNNFMLVSSLTKGELTDKTQCLKIMMERPLKNFSIDSLLVKSYGNIAVVTVWIKQDAQADGNDWSGNFIDTDVWVNTNGNWQITSRHSTWLK